MKEQWGEYGTENESTGFPAIQKLWEWQGRDFASEYSEGTNYQHLNFELLASLNVSEKIVVVLRHLVFFVVVVAVTAAQRNKYTYILNYI